MQRSCAFRRLVAVAPRRPFVSHVMSTPRGPTASNRASPIFGTTEAVEPSVRSETVVVPL
eukprot:6200408-Pleurochrysis_carterae.AAC.4